MLKSARSHGSSMYSAVCRSYRYFLEAVAAGIVARKTSRDLARKWVWESVNGGAAQRPRHQQSGVHKIGAGSVAAATERKRRQ